MFTPSSSKYICLLFGQCSWFIAFAILFTFITLVEFLYVHTKSLSVYGSCIFLVFLYAEEGIGTVISDVHT